jgi:hypothetical protein
MSSNLPTFNDGARAEIKLIGNDLTWIKQSDQKITQGPDGSVQATLSYKCKWISIKQFIPTPLQKHPEFPSLLLYEYSLEKEPGEIGRFDLVYRGVLLNNTDLGKLAQEEATLTISTEPIETHPTFAGKRDATGNWPASPPVSKSELNAIDIALRSSVNYTSSNTAAQKLYDRKLRGIDSYYRIGTTYRNNYVQTKAPVAGQYAVVGKSIINDSFKQIYSNAPVPAEGQAYLMTGLSWRKAGGAYYINQEFQLSGNGGWDSVLYEQTDVATTPYVAPTDIPSVTF